MHVCILLSQDCNWMSDCFGNPALENRDDKAANELGAETACTLHLTENLPVADEMKVDLKGNHGLVASKAV